MVCGKVFGSVAYTVKCEKLMVICWGMAVKRMGALGVKCEDSEGSACDDGDTDTDWKRETESDMLCDLTNISSAI